MKMLDFYQENKRALILYKEKLVEFLQFMPKYILLDPIPHTQRQFTGDCPLVALAIIAFYWLRKGKIKKFHPAHPHDFEGFSGDSLLHIYRSLGLKGLISHFQIDDKNFGLFFVGDVLLARAAGMCAQTYKIASQNMFSAIIDESLQSSIPVLVNFYVNEGGWPTSAKGQKDHGHAGVIIGSFTAANHEKFLIMTHGHGGYYIFPERVLYRSISQFPIDGNSIAIVFPLDSEIVNNPLLKKFAAFFIPSREWEHLPSFRSNFTSENADKIRLSPCSEITINPFNNSNEFAKPFSCFPLYLSP
jgi:hypothetical protein